MHKAQWKIGVVVLAGLLAIFGQVLLPRGASGSVPAGESEEFAGGDGSAENPYLIATPRHLDNVRHHLDAHFRQVADIDLADERGWEPIGYYEDWDDQAGFAGSFDGDGHKIQNLSVDVPFTVKAGLFGYLDATASILNVALEDVDVSGIKNVGALAGRNNRGHIAGSHATGRVRGQQVVGGLVGRNDLGRIERSFASVQVTGETWVGGLVGYNWGEIKNSYATGDVSGRRYGGGLAGGNHTGTVTNCYAAGKVVADAHAGGLTGWNEGRIEGGYFDKDASGQDLPGRGIPTSGDMMRRRETFEGWDFDDVWTIVEMETYPHLQWQEDHIPAVRQ